MPSRQVARPMVTRMTDRQRTCRFLLIHNRRGAGSKKSWSNQSPVFTYFTNSSMLTTCFLYLIPSWYELSPAFGNFSRPCLILVSSTVGGSYTSCHESRGSSVRFDILDPESARILCLMTCDLPPLQSIGPKRDLCRPCRGI